VGDFTVRGIVTDAAGKAVGNVKVFAVDSDQGLFEDHNDDLLGSAWTKSDGTFEIAFSSEEFGEGLVEGDVDIYFVVRNSKGEAIARFEPEKDLKPSNKSDLFEIKIGSLEKDSGPPEDLYLRNTDRTLTAFASTGDVAAVNNNDFARVFGLLDRSLNAWVVYTRENSWNEIRYDGPQVPARPKEIIHKHELQWEARKK
jgi:hypothetical protein